jgi:hypothetical protein
MTCDFTYKDVSWADAIGTAGGYVSLADFFFTMLVIIVYLICTGQPPKAVVNGPSMLAQTLRSGHALGAHKHACNAIRLSLCLALFAG